MTRMEFLQLFLLYVFLFCSSILIFQILDWWRWEVCWEEGPTILLFVPSPLGRKKAVLWSLPIICSSVVIMICALRTSFRVVFDFSGQSWSRGSDVKWWHFRRWYSTRPGRGNASVLLSVVEVTWNGRLHLLLLSFFSFFFGRILILWLKDMKDYILYHWQLKQITWRNKRYNWMEKSSHLDKFVFHMFETSKIEYVQLSKGSICMDGTLKAQVRENN